MRVYLFVCLCLLSDSLFCFRGVGETREGWVGLGGLLKLSFGAVRWKCRLIVNK